MDKIVKAGLISGIREKTAEIRFPYRTAILTPAIAGMQALMAQEGQRLPAALIGGARGMTMGLGGDIGSYIGTATGEKLGPDVLSLLSGRQITPGERERYENFKYLGQPIGSVAGMYGGFKLSDALINELVGKKRLQEIFGAGYAL